MDASPKNQKAVFISIVITGLNAVIAGTGCGHASDGSMRVNFVNHEGAFNELKNLFMHDVDVISISRTVIVGREKTVSLSSGKPGDFDNAAISAARYAIYLNLFDQLGLKGGITRDTRRADSINFPAELPSLLNGDSTKGYWYSPDEVTPCFENLERYKPPQILLQRREGYAIFSPLKTHWYLYKSW
jgi:hypothetical protein